MAWRTLFRNRDYRRLWSARVVSQLGSRVSRDALPLAAVIVLAASPLQLGLLAAAGAVPALLLALPAGVWVDRARRRPLLVAADLGRALALLLVPVAAVMGWLDLGLLCAVAAVAGTLTVLFDVADQSLLPSVVARAELLDANAGFGVAASLAELLGPALAGALVQLITAPLAVLADAASFLVSAVFIAGVRTPEVARAPADAPALGWAAELRAGLAIVRDDRDLRALLCASAGLAFVGSFFGALYYVYAIRVLALSPAVLGVVIAAGGAGALIGASVAGPLAARFGTWRVLAGGLLVSGALIALVPLARGPQPIAAGMLFVSQLVGDTGLAAFFVAEVTLRQTLAPADALGRVNALAKLASTGVAPLGLLLGGLLGETVGIRPTLAAAAAGIFSVGAWLALRRRGARGSAIP